MNLLRHRAFSLERLITALAVLMTVSHFYVIIVIPFTMDQFKNLNIMFSLVIFYLLQIQQQNRGSFSKVIDVAFIVLSLVATAYVHFNYNNLALMMGIMDLPAIVMGTILLVVVWESARRFWGLLIPGFVLLMLIYAYYGKYFPDPFYHGGISYDRIIGYSTMFFRGIYGRLTGAGASLVFPLFIFANLLSALGGRKMFSRLGKILAAKFKSGPAQAAVLCSLFMGSISGSTTANVATTGSFTIPMMKATGYKPRYAAAVESVASTGGQFMPPIMGATAFVMAGFAMIPYETIVIAALLPAFLFYFFISFSLELRAHRDNISAASGSINIDDSIISIIKEHLHLLLATTVMIYLLAIRYPASMAVVYGIVCLIGFVFLKIVVKDKDKVKGIKELAGNVIAGLETAAKMGAPLFLFFALVSVAIEMLVVTGLALKFSYWLIGLSGGDFFVLLLMTAVTCIIFGMGMPSVSAYMLVALLGAPALVEAGNTFLASHMFVYIIAVFSAITPPIAVAPMVASSIAKSEFWGVALTSVRLGLPGFIIPFYFMYQPALLIVNSSIGSIISAFLYVLIALISLSVALEGYFFKEIKIIERLLLATVAILLLNPGLHTTILGIGIFVILVAKIVIFRRESYEDSKKSIGSR